MKKIFFAAGLLLMGTTLFAQSEKYLNAMQANISALDTSFKDPQNLLNVAARFERIADKEKSQWLPYYWAGYCQVVYTYLIQDKSTIDPLADKAELLLKKADSLQPNNSEISCVFSMLATARMLVDPMTRYATYGTMSDNYLSKAILQNPENPRPYYLRGQGLRYTPEQFGGGCKAAINLLKEADEKFKAFKPASDIDPNWGEEQTRKLISDCNQTP